MSIHGELFALGAKQLQRAIAVVCAVLLLVGVAIGALIVYFIKG